MIPQFSARVRKTLLTVHVLSSVGWFGTVLAFLVLAIAGYLTPSVETTAGVYESLRLLIWFVILPLSLLALVTGVVQSLGTPWGLVRYYWVLFKLILTVGATAALILHTRVVDRAASGDLSHDMSGIRMQLIIDSAAALVVLTLMTVLSVVKPRGTTPWGRRTRPGTSALVTNGRP